MMNTVKSRTGRRIILACMVLVLLLVTANQIWSLYRKNAIGSVGKNIIREIESHADENGNCTIEFSALTDFEWDTLVVFDADFSVVYGGYQNNTDLANEKMSEVLGFAYERMTGYRSYLIFVKNGELVHEESYLADIESPSKMNISVSSERAYPGITNCCV